MSFFAPLSSISSTMMNYVVAPIALTAGMFFMSGCGGGEDPLGPNGRPPQGPIVTDPDDEDPCDGLSDEDLGKCRAEDALMARYGIDFVAKDFSFNGEPTADATSSYTVEREGGFIPCSDVPDYMQSLVSNSSVCFRGIAKWSSRPPSESFPPSDDPTYMIANASVGLREQGASLCETRYESMYDGYNQYGYEIKETESRPEVLNFCSEELDSYDGPIGFVHAVSGVYDPQVGMLHLDWPNTIGGATPPSHENASTISAIALYYNADYPTFGETDEGDPTGLIDNEGILFRTASDNVMSFKVSSDLSSDSVTLTDSETDLDGNTVSSLSATLYKLGN